MYFLCFSFNMQKEKCFIFMTLIFGAKTALSNTGELFDINRNWIKTYIYVIDNYLKLIKIK